MEDRIKLLPEKVANQIAAGEVVNRPASVVKEMMENSIDAGATEVIVNFRNNGRDLIQIVDNGVGMTPNDARMAFERHATSKISKADDIYALHTFGFRGEALASIAAVAQVELRTKHRDSEMGTITTINGGEFVDQQPTLCDQGTQFKVRNLFYNIRARRSFIERESSKGILIREEFRRVALCNPDRALELYGDDSPIFKLRPTTLAGRIVDIFGDSTKKNILDINTHTVIVNISGFIGTPKIRKGATSHQYMFVNGRYFRSPYLHKAVMKGYEKIIPDGVTPSYFLFLEVEPDRVDVNVHPQKTEVKFADESSIWQILNAAVRETLARTGAVPLMEFDNSSQIEIPVMKQGVSYAEPRATNNNDYNPFEIEQQEVVDPSKYAIEIPSTYQPSEKRSKKPKVASQSSLYSSWTETEFEDMEFEGVDIESTTSHSETPISIDSEWSSIDIESSESQPQQQSLIEEEFKHRAHIGGDISVVGGRYCWCRVDNDMVAVDIKRAKERLLYDYYLTTLKGGSAISQQILFPIELRLSADEYVLMEERAVEFSILGFDIEYCDKDLIQIKGLPADLSQDCVDTLIYELLQIMATPMELADELRDRLAKAMARSSSTSYGRNVSTQQAKEIVDQLFRSGNIGHTPFGKRIMWRITKEDIKHHLA